MDEGRKRVLLIAASILAARKLAQLQSTRLSPALNSAIHDSIIFAERILKKIDELYPSRTRFDGFESSAGRFYDGCIAEAREKEVIPEVHE